MSADAELAVVIRQAQWLLDDTAHDQPAQRYPPDKQQELAEVLESLAVLLRHRYRGMVIEAVDDHRTLRPPTLAR